MDEETKDLTVSVNVSNGNDGFGSAQAVLNGTVVRSVNFDESLPELHVGGGGLLACLREGPGVRFTGQGGIKSSEAVNWLSEGETCLLPGNCEGM